ncbi:MAG TPA: hypothetical protein VGM67_07900 [Gemmatimonadaceae bacterium]|jgi:hypothetical protein
MSFRRLFVLALVVAMPGVARAQFTTFIPPQPKVVDTAKAATSVATATARVDTTMNTQLTNMKTWVDSAAGVAPSSLTAADSLATATTALTDTTVSTTTTMRNGARAPATASALPLIALLGASMLSVGLLLLAGPRTARDRTAPDRG